MIHSTIICKTRATANPWTTSLLSLARRRLLKTRMIAIRQIFFVPQIMASSTSIRCTHFQYIPQAVSRTAHPQVKLQATSRKSLSSKDTHYLLPTIRSNLVIRHGNSSTTTWAVRSLSRVLRRLCPKDFCYMLLLLSQSLAEQP